jgi:hypothetical protein
VEVKPLRREQRQELQDALFGRFLWLMTRANFTPLGRDAIEKAMRDVSDWGLNMEVDFNVFDRLDVYVRGDAMSTRYRRLWRNFFRREAVQVPSYRRLVLIMKLRPHKRLGRDIDTSAVFLKIFQDIPKVDVEMLLLGGLAYILYNVVGQVFKAVALGAAALLGPLAALLGYGYKQWYGYQVAKQTYSLQLTQSLYYQNLDSNAGVLHHLLDEAEEQECREAILAYYYLWRFAGERGWTPRNLDDYVELDLERLANVQVDFEIADALEKLEKLNIVERVEGRYRAYPIDKALEMLDWAWDNAFRYANREEETAPVPQQT